MRYIGPDPLPLVVTVAEFSAAVHGIVTPAEEPALADLLAAAQDVVATATNTPLVPGTYELTCPLEGWRRWWLPCRPVSAITALAVSGDGNSDGDDGSSDGFTNRDLTDVTLLQGQDEPQLLLPEGWASHNDYGHILRAQVQAGATPPPALRRAIIALAQDWREADISLSPGEAPARSAFGVQRLIRQARYRRPQITAQA